MERPRTSQGYKSSKENKSSKEHKSTKEFGGSLFTPNSSISTLEKHGQGFGFSSSVVSNANSLDKFPSLTAPSSSASVLNFQLTKQAARDHFLATPLISGAKTNYLLGCKFNVFILQDEGGSR